MVETGFHNFLIYGVIKGEIQNPLICQQNQTRIFKHSVLEIYEDDCIFKYIMPHLHLHLMPHLHLMMTFLNTKKFAVFNIISHMDLYADIHYCRYIFILFTSIVLP